MPVPQRRSARVRHGVFLVIDRSLDWIPSPTARARVLRLLGATVGANVRVHQVRMFNLGSGYANLRVDDDVHIGTGCLLDLSDEVHIGTGAVLAPRAVVLTHQDAGSHHDSPVAVVIGTKQSPTTVGAGAFIGAGATLLCGADVGHHAVVAAGAVVTGPVEPGELVAGVPAVRHRSLRAELTALGVDFDDAGAPAPELHRP